VLPAEPPAPVSAQAETTCTHVYVDESGKSICADGWDEIPKRFRPTARPVGRDGLEGEKEGFLLWSEGEPSEQGRLDTIYRYRNSAGRECFTNIWDRVPAASREKAEVVDLSRVSLNTPVGREIEERLEEEHRKLIGSDYCRLALQEEDKRWWASAWTEFGPLLAVGSVIVFLLLITPFAMRRMSAPQWARTLTVAVQVLTLVGLIAFAIIKTNSAYRSLRGQAAPCRVESWKKAAGKPDELARQAELVRELQRRIRLFRQEGLLSLQEEHGASTVE
jgi:hypothetical protein